MWQLAGTALVHTAHTVHTSANPISPDTLLSGSTALLVLAIVLFAECGLLIGFFLPGDTLLFAAGISLSVGTIHTPLAAFLIVAGSAVCAQTMAVASQNKRPTPPTRDPHTAGFVKATELPDGAVPPPAIPPPWMPRRSAPAWCRCSDV